MASMDPTLNVRVLADTSQLGGGLMQAESMVRRSTVNMGSQVDGVMGRMGKAVTSRLAGAFNPYLIALNFADTSLRVISDAIKNDQSIPDALQEGLMKGIKDLPLVGAIVELAEPAAESFGEMFARAWIETYGDSGNIIYSDRTNAIFEEQAQRIRASLEAELATLQEVKAAESDPMSQVLSGLRSTAIEQGDTALGAFRFGIGGSAADISRDLSSRAEEQVTVLRRIEEIQKELRDSLKGGN